MNDGLQLQPMFSVPILSVVNGKYEILHERLIKLFHDIEFKMDNNKTPFVERNNQVFESRFNLFKRNEEPIRELYNFCIKNLYTCIGQMNGYSQEELMKLHLAEESWFHITRKGGYFGIHNHANSAWSGVYCVSPGDDCSDDNNSGVLTFISPHMASSGYIDKSCSNFQSQYTRGNFKVKLKEGQLVLFPSWLLHEVKPYLGESERITVAFNTWFRYSG